MNLVSRDIVQFNIDKAGFEKGLRAGAANFFAGWVINLTEDNPIDHVNFKVGDAVLGSLPIKHDRPDLLKVYQKSLLGFWGPVMIPEEYFRATLCIEAIAKNGMRFRLQDYVIEESVPVEEKRFREQNNLPADMLRLLVVSNIDPYLFVQKGNHGVELIRRLLDEHHIDIHSFRNILDFGVGCGRIIRWWEDLSTSISFWGTDINELLVRWCKENIRFGSFGVNSLNPPTSYENSKFDFLYALSVFTHLALKTQSEWLAEFARILGPERFALISVHGDKDARSLSEESLLRYSRDGYLTMSENVEGENACATYQNRTVTEQVCSEWFDVMDFVPSGWSSTSNQDIYLLKKK